MAQPQTPEQDLPDRDAGWRPRPKRLLIGLAFIAAGILLSLLNSAHGQPGAGSTGAVVHGPAGTYVKTLDGMRVRPELAPATTAAGPVAVTISFHNDAAVARVVSPRDVRLLVGGRVVTPTPVGPHSSPPLSLPPGHYVTDVLRFAHGLAPGAALDFRPAWAHGAALRWVLWR